MAPSPFFADGDADFVDGAIYTGDPARLWARAVAVRDGRIAAIGEEGDIASAGGAAPRIDLRGAMA